jgi:hypothetical protein
MSFLEWRDYFFSEYRVESCRNDIITEAIINESYIIKVENAENFSFRQHFADDSLTNSPIKKIEMCIEDKVELENLTKSLLAMSISDEQHDTIVFSSLKANIEEGIVYKPKFQSSKDLNRNILDKISESNNKWIYSEKGFEEDKPQDSLYNLPLKNESSKSEYKKKEMRIEIDKHDNFKSEILKLNEDENNKKEEKTDNHKIKKEPEIFNNVVKNQLNSKEEEQKCNKETDIFKEMKNSFNLGEDEIDNYLKDARTYKTNKKKENCITTENEKKVEINNNVKIDFQTVKEHASIIEVKENKQINPVKFIDPVNIGIERKEDSSKINSSCQNRIDEIKNDIGDSKNIKREEGFKINIDKKSEVFNDFNKNKVVKNSKTFEPKEKNSGSKISFKNVEKDEELVVDNKIDKFKEEKKDAVINMDSVKEELVKSSQINSNNIKEEYKIENYIDNNVLNDFLEKQNRKKNKNEILEKELTDKVNVLKQQNKVVSDENKKLLEILHLYKIIQNIENKESNIPINQEEKNIIVPHKTSKIHNRIKMQSELENPFKESEEFKQKNIPINPIISEPISKQNYIDMKDRKRDTGFGNIINNLPRNTKNTKQLTVKNKFKQFIDLKLISPDSNSKSYKEIYKNQVRVKSPERETIIEEGRKSNVMSPSQHYSSRGKGPNNHLKSNRSGQNYYGNKY